jgi:protein translocase SecG subunit
LQTVNTILTALLVLLSLVLIVVVTMQTPKSEGFGSVTNTPSSNFRGKAGYDEMLSGYTRSIAIAWFATALVLGILNQMASRG